MFIAHTVSDLRYARQTIAGPVAFVPTMGALHAGHVHLIHEAKKHAANVVVSIFVNPSQFGPHEDFTRYPRPIERDLSLCRKAGAVGVFNPGVEDMYPTGDGAVASSVSIPSLASILEGEHRPGHFDGVCRVVAKLFNLVRPDAALFGKKDYQQLAVIQAMVNDLNMPLRIVPIETVREPDGLAMSSRNVYLSAEERGRATGLIAALKRGEDQILGGETSPSIIEATLRRTITEHGIDVNYASVRHPASLRPVDRIVLRAAGGPGVVLLVAGKLGPVRLLDNKVVTGA